MDKRIKIDKIYDRLISSPVLITFHKILDENSFKLLCILGLVAIQTFLLGNSIEFNFTNIINGGDTQQLLNPQLFIKRSFSVWLDSSTGIPLLMPGQWIFYAIPLYVLNLFFENITISTFMLFAMLYSLASVSMFLLSEKIVSNNGLSFFVSLFYSLNLYTAIQHHTPTTHILYFYGVTPLLVLIFTYIESLTNYRKKLFYMLLYLFLYLPLIRITNMFILYLVLIPLIGFIINFRVKILIKRLLKYFALTSLMILLVASPFLVPLIFCRQTVITPVTDAYSKSAVQVALGQKLEDSIRFIRSFAWKCSYNESFGGVLSYSFLRLYGQNLFLSFISYYPILIVFFLFLFNYPALNNLDKYRVIGLLFLVVSSLFFTTPSLTSLGTLLYENEIYIFRSSWKYFSIPYILCLSLILAFLLRRFIFGFRTRKIFIFSLIFCLIHLVYILPVVGIYGKTVNQSWIVETPREYFEVSEFLNHQKEEFRILPLPFSTNLVGYTPYKWGYVGPDILYTLTDKPLIDKFHNTIAPIEYLELTGKLCGATPQEILQYCHTLNVKYILLRNDVDLENPYQKVYNSPEYYRCVLDNSDDIKEKYIFGNIVLYELKSYTPRIFIISANSFGLDNSLPEKFLYSTYQPENLSYLHFVENPITLKVSKKESIESFNFKITFDIEQKNITKSDWQANNHVLIQTDLFKISISPKREQVETLLYFFSYLNNGSLWSTVIPFERNKAISNINLDFKNDILSIYLNEIKICEVTIKLIDKFSFIKIGSNLADTERLVGKVYDLNFSVNEENIVSTKKLSSIYPDYMENEIFYKLHLSYEKTEFRKLSPTKYVVTLDNPSAEEDFFLVFLSTYNPYWKAYYVENGVVEAIPEDNHIHAFDYGNAWFLNKTGNITILLEYTLQKIYNLGFKISLSTFIILILITIIPKNRLIRLKILLCKTLSSRFKSYNRLAIERRR